MQPNEKQPNENLFQKERKRLTADLVRAGYAIPSDADAPIRYTVFPDTGSIGKPISALQVVIYPNSDPEPTPEELRAIQERLRDTLLGLGWNARLFTTPGGFAGVSIPLAAQP